MKTREEILDSITQLQLDHDERLGDLASHSLDLSPEFESIQESYLIKLRNLQAELDSLAVDRMVVHMAEYNLEMSKALAKMNY